MVDAGGVYIGLGSNLGDRDAHIRQALNELAADADIRVLRSSKFHETEAVGGPDGQPRYLNAVAELATDLDPHALLNRLQQIEARHGRERHVPNGPRTLDLDLLIYRNLSINTQDLRVPHPRMWQRDFVIEPLQEICEPQRLAAAHQCAAAAESETANHVR